MKPNSNKLIRILTLFALAFMPIALLAQVSQAVTGAPVARMATKQYWAPDLGPYMEVQMAFDGRSVAWVDAGRSADSGEPLVRAAVEWTVIALDEAGEIVDFRKSVARTERLESPSDFIDIVRMPLAPGHYAFEWLGVDLGVDLSAGAEAAEMRYDAPIYIDTLSRSDISELFWVQAYAPASATPTALARGGLKMLPLVSGQVGIDAERLPFYGEVYGSEMLFGEGTEFLVSAWFRSEAGETFQHRYFKKKAAAVVPIFETMELPVEPGLYDLVLDMRTREGAPIVSRSLSFDLLESAQDAEGQFLEQLAPFVLKYTSRDSLWKDLLTLDPIAGAVELRTLEFTLAGSELASLQGFMDAFWRRRNAENPGAAWEDYQREVAIVDHEYRDCRNRPGHQTEMGAILLQYGRPNTVVKRHHGTRYYPYEIWHYHKAGQFNDKRFLFYSPMAVSACFELLHSDMLGFVRNNDWLTLLRTRENGNSVHQTMLNGLNPSDSFSREEPEELFYNPK